MHVIGAQVDARLSYDTEATISRARRIIGALSSPSSSASCSSSSSSC